MRSALLQSAGGIVLLPGTVDAGNPKAGASMGAYFALPVVNELYCLQHKLEQHRYASGYRQPCGSHLDR